MRKEDMATFTNAAGKPITLRRVDIIFIEGHAWQGSFVHTRSAVPGTAYFVRESHGEALALWCGEASEEGA
jgi:hypothetical protein